MIRSLLSTSAATNSTVSLRAVSSSTSYSSTRARATSATLRVPSQRSKMRPPTSSKVGTLDASAAKILKAGAVQVAERATNAQRALVRAHGALTRARISTIALKGPALARRVWGEVKLRASSDCDILVAERDLSSALEVL